MIEILNIFFLIASIIWICSFPLIQSNSRINFVFNELGNLEWIEFRNLNEGAHAFKQIHDGSCSAPKIILIP